MKKFESFEDYKNDIIDRSNLINKGLCGLSPSDATALICSSIDFYCASVGFNGSSTAKFYDQIAYLGREMNR